jgi:GNAT superfamily N-acetyltransferase
VIERVDSLPEGLEINAVALRIKALYNTYCESVGVDLFIQKVKDKVTAVFGGMDGSFSLICFENADFDELDSYFGFLGATVFCFGEVAEVLKPKRVSKSKLYVFDGDVTLTDFDGNGGISKVYDALKYGEDGDILLPAFDLWYTDFCLRFNHNSAEYFLLDGSVAAAGFVTDEASLITGVAVDKVFRKKGLGSEVLRGLIYKIREKHPKSMIFAATQNAADFYIKNSFKYDGTVAVCEYWEKV